MSKRADAVGLFWEDFAPVKAPPKEKIKRTPPERFWEEADYLPSLPEALAWKPDLFTDIELWQASINKEKLTWDIEVYPNYCLFAFKSIVSKKVIYFELYEDDQTFDIPKLEWILRNFTVITFNGKKYDAPITTLALAGYGSESLWEATCMIIVERLQSKDVYKRFNTKSLETDHIDLIQLTALNTSLKAAGARLHCPKLQDLPVKAGTWLNTNQIAIVRFYCINDLDNTELLYNDLQPQIEIREVQGKKYGLDLRSHSDAQMAEAIISTQLKKISGKKRINRTELPAGTWYNYKPQRYLKYNSIFMNSVLSLIANAVFHIDPIQGTLIMPKEVAELAITIGKATYQMGIGGLHSQEKTIAHVADENYFIADTDATSYYPYLILNAGITPSNLGANFLIVYNGIVVERVSAKQLGFASVAECLKIVVNGTFGKLGSPWSIMYAPNLMMQVTIGGQLSMLMLVETFELNDIEVVSVNTDGIVVKCLRSKEALFNQIVKDWEKVTGFSTEEVRYKAVYSRDINNYIAIYEKPQKGELLKLKGAYAKTSSKKNAVNEICIDAVKAMITTQTPIAQTIMSCRQISRFTTMRQVTGGCVKDNQYLGKVARWYYAEGVEGVIISTKKGATVPRTEGAKPCMDLPDTFPTDINYQWYIDEAYSILEDIGYTPKQLLLAA
jgi:hypothetical protein